MNEVKYNVYLAAPFFMQHRCQVCSISMPLYYNFCYKCGTILDRKNDGNFQIKVVREIESVLELVGYNVYSPSRDGIILERNASLDNRKMVFEDNVNAILRADLVVVVIDDKDSGSIWEMGFAYGNRIPIVTYTGNDYDINVMLANSVVAHARGLDELRVVTSKIVSLWNTLEWNATDKQERGRVISENFGTRYIHKGGIL